MKFENVIPPKRDHPRQWLIFRKTKQDTRRRNYCTIYQWQLGE